MRGVLWLPIGPTASLPPAPAPNGGSLLAGPAARLRCVKCRLRARCLITGGLGVPRAWTRRDVGRQGLSARLCAGSHGTELALNPPGSGRVLGEKRPRYWAQAGSPSVTRRRSQPLSAFVVWRRRQRRQRRRWAAQAGPEGTSPEPLAYLPGQCGVHPAFSRGTALGEEQCSPLGLFLTRNAPEWALFSVKLWLGTVRVCGSAQGPSHPSVCGSR